MDLRKRMDQMKAQAEPDGVRPENAEEGNAAAVSAPAAQEAPQTARVHRREVGADSLAQTRQVIDTIEQRIAEGYRVPL